MRWILVMLLAGCVESTDARLANAEADRAAMMERIAQLEADRDVAFSQAKAMAAEVATLTTHLDRVAAQAGVDALDAEAPVWGEVLAEVDCTAIEWGFEERSRYVDIMPAGVPGRYEVYRIILGDGSWSVETVNRYPDRAAQVRCIPTGNEVRYVAVAR